MRRGRKENEIKKCNWIKLYVMLNKGITNMQIT
jgi:hypothetical protein